MFNLNILEIEQEYKIRDFCFVLLTIWIPIYFIELLNHFKNYWNMILKVLQENNTFMCNWNLLIILDCFFDKSELILLLGNYLVSVWLPTVAYLLELDAYSVSFFYSHLVDNWPEKWVFVAVATYLYLFLLGQTFKDALFFWLLGIMC